MHLNNNDNIQNVNIRNKADPKKYFVSDPPGEEKKKSCGWPGNALDCSKQILKKRFPP